jgi:hypothetical protein
VDDESLGENVVAEELLTNMQHSYSATRHSAGGRSSYATASGCIKCRSP